MSPIEKSSKLDNVCYDIRGPVLKEAKRLEEEGNKVLKLNIGNPAPFGFEAPDEILVDVIRNLPTAQGYCDSKGLTPHVKPSCSTTRRAVCVMLPLKISISATAFPN
jgi:alanine-synthesizing transaminase